MGAWSDCILDRPGQQAWPGQQAGPGRHPETGRTDEEEEQACGAGTRHRNLTCLDTRTGTPAPFHLCLQGPVVFANQLIER
jgi:hypothetical protein